jgi:hypothetical protein
LRGEKNRRKASLTFHWDAEPYEKVSLPLQAVLAVAWRTRVTRLDEFSPIGLLFTLGRCFFKKNKSSQISGRFFCSAKLKRQFLARKNGSVPRDFFSQTHLVTQLPGTDICSETILSREERVHASLARNNRRLSSRLGERE